MYSYNVKVVNFLLINESQVTIHMVSGECVIHLLVCNVSCEMNLETINGLV